MKSLHTSSIVCYSLLAVSFTVSLSLRIAVPWSQVFSGGWIKFTDNDAYFYVRLLDNLSRHFPALGRIDPYYLFPADISLSGVPFFFPQFMGFFAWLFGAGAPSQQLVDQAGVYFPAIAGALTVFPAFFIGRSLFNRWAGLAAAGFMALMPGEFLIRTLLGNADGHVMEILFTTLLMLCVVLAVQKGRTLEFPGCLRERRGDTLWTLACGALAGLCLGIYLLSWQGALLFVFIIFLWLVIQSAVDHLMGKPTVYLALAGVPAFLIALLMALPSVADSTARLSLATALLVSAALPAISWLMRRRSLNPMFFPTVILGLGLAALAVLYFISPSVLRAMPGTVGGFFTWKTGAAIAEMQPLLIQQGSFTLALAWGNYTAASVLGLIGFGYVIYRTVTRFEPAMLLMLLWSFIIAMSALAMRRFAYYLAVNTALLAGFTCGLMLAACGLKDEGLPAPARTGGKKDRPGSKKQQKGRPAPAYNRGYLAAGVIAVLFLVIYPNTGPLPGGDRPFFDVATRALYTPPDGWCEAMDWLKTKTPEPYGGPDYYYARYETPPAGSGFAYPGSAYSVVCWWDYGYWVSRLGHRAPFSNPGSAQRGEQHFYLAQDEYAAARLATAWGGRYTVVNDSLLDWQKGFGSLCASAGEPLSKYCEIYYRPQGGRLTPTLLYYPEYYRTMAARLYCFDGRPYAPAETAAVSWEARTGSDGKAYREITGLKTFRSYDEAVYFLKAQTSGNWRLVGKDPGASPVPLEELKLHRLAFSSPEKVKTGNLETARVKIFEYTRDAVPLAGDWNGDKKAETGLWQPQTGHFLLDMNGDGKWGEGDIRLGPFGYAYDIPVAGDWDGDGKWQVGVWRPAEQTYYLDAGRGNPESAQRKAGISGRYLALPVAGDWNGDGRSETGEWVAWRGEFFLDTGKAGGSRLVRLGIATDAPIAGDWTGSGSYNAGVREPSERTFKLKVSSSDLWDPGRGDLKLGPFGGTDDVPLAGDWTGKGRSLIGTWNPHDRCFYLDMDGDGKWGEADRKLGPFGE
jgi:dolichyl-diphosphooligosaccharide--protein glycosyltransferase